MICDISLSQVQVHSSIVQQIFKWTTSPNITKILIYSTLLISLQQNFAKLLFLIQQNSPSVSNTMIDLTALKVRKNCRSRFRWYKKSTIQKQFDNSKNCSNHQKIHMTYYCLLHVEWDEKITKACVDLEDDGRN